MRLAVSLLAFFLLFACSKDVKQENAEPAQPTATPTAESASDPSINVSRGLPDWVKDNKGEMAVGIDAAGNLVVITYGSGSNPERVVAASYTDGAISVRIEAEDGPSTMDFVPTTSIVTFSEPLRPKASIAVDLGKFGAVRVGPERQVLTVVPER